MTKVALTKKYGSVAKGLSKRIQAGQMMKKAGIKFPKKGKSLSSGELSKKEMMEEADRFNPFKKAREKR